MTLPDLHRSELADVAGNLIDVEAKLDSLNERVAFTNECLTQLLGQGEAVTSLLSKLLGLAEEREARERVQAEFVKLLTSGAAGPEAARPYEDYRESPAGGAWEVLLGDGTWHPANAAEAAEIRALVAYRRRRRS